MESGGKVDAQVLFESFENERDGSPLEEVCPVVCLRPRPVSIKVDEGSVYVGQEVDLFRDMIWWEGVIVCLDRGIDVRLHCDDSMQRDVGVDTIRQGLVFDICWYERTNSSRRSRQGSNVSRGLGSEKDDIVIVEASTTQFEVDCAATACCIISMLNGLSVLRDPGKLHEWNDVWLAETMDANVKCGAQEFTRLQSLYPKMFMKSGYTNVSSVCAESARGGMVGEVQFLVELSKFGFIAEKPKGMANTVHNSTILFSQVRKCN